MTYLANLLAINGPHDKLNISYLRPANCMSSPNVRGHLTCIFIHLWTGVDFNCSSDMTLTHLNLTFMAHVEPQKSKI